jgi:alpha-beta hydrolase superfamily lysophospholipase
VARFLDYVLDLDAVLDLVAKRHPGLPLVLLGHSFGGLIALEAVLSGRARGATALVLSSPCLGVPRDKAPSPALRLIARILSSVWPTFPFPNRVDPAHLSHDPAVGEAYRADPLVVRTVTPRWFVEADAAMTRVRARGRALPLRTLVVYAGSDRIVDPGATRLFAAGLPPGLAESTCYEDLFHEILNEPQAGLVLDRILAFLAPSLP